MGYLKWEDGSRWQVFREPGKRLDKTREMLTVGDGRAPRTREPFETFMFPVVEEMTLPKIRTLWDCNLDEASQLYAAMKQFINEVDNEYGG